MRRPLLALSLALTTSLGAIPVADVLAAASGNFPLSTAPTGSSTDKSSQNKPLAVSGAAIVQTAMKYLGYPYSATGNSPSTGFSCIGFVSYVYRSLGMQLPGDLGGALAFAPQVSFSSLLPGDILYFQNTIWPGLSHAAIYIGGGKFIHAEWYNRGVVISSFANDPVDGNYWTAKYLGANRPWTGAAVPSLPGSTPPGPPTVPGATSVTTTSTVTTGPAAVVNAPSLYVRSGPSKTSAVVQVVPRGTSMVVIGQSGKWDNVRLPDGTVGWVAAKWITVAGAVTTNQTPPVPGNGNVGTPVAPARTGYPSRHNTRGTVLVRATALRVHSNPSMSAPVVTTLAQGQRLQILARSPGWIQVRLPDGTSGWISSSYVSTPGGTRRPTGGSTSTKTGTQGGATAKVAVNVRSGPSLQNSVVTVLSVGASYRVIGWSAGWAHVQLANGTIGWISGSVLGSGRSGPSYNSRTNNSYTYQRKTRTPSRTPGTSGGSVITAGVRVHSSPGVNAPVITLAAAGTHVRILGYRGGWALVRLPGGATGYVMGSYVH